MPQCPECSTYDWSKIIAEARAKGEPTPDHHHECGIAKAEKFGRLMREGIEHLRGQLFKLTTPPDDKPAWWGLVNTLVQNENWDDGSPLVYRPVGVGISCTSEGFTFAIELLCRCGATARLKVTTPPTSGTCWKCHRDFTVEYEDEFINEFIAAQDYHITPDALATITLAETSGTFILCPKCGSSNSFDPDARLGDCYCPKCGAAPYHLA